MTLEMYLVTFSRLTSANFVFSSQFQPLKIAFDQEEKMKLQDEIKFIFVSKKFRGFPLDVVL